MKNLLLIFIFLSKICLLAQEKYKYAIVPLKFGFQKSENQYNLNTMSKKMLETYGLTTYFENELPENFDLCNALVLDIHENNSMLVTKFTLELKDCKNKVLFQSAEGKSREKDFKKSYNEALRNASVSFNNYDFMNKPNNVALKKIIENQVENRIINKTENTTNIAENINIIQENLYQLLETTYGFELLNSKNEKIAQLFKTSNSSIFIAKTTDYQGIATITFKKCTLEYYKENQLQQMVYVVTQ